MYELKIATGESRFETKWKNKTTTWETLIKRLKNTTRTAETHGEYLKMSKSKQDDIKDVGGFVGGWLKEGRRKNGNVELRSILTLDADFAEVDFWSNYTMLFDWQSLIYSTHKHTTKAPRLRLIIALSREAAPEEYEAVGRQVASKIGIDQFDDTTYQASRLMYWPSTSQDAPYVFEHQEGQPLDVDAILAEYPNWTDISYWPMSSREKEVRVSLSKKQQDPLDKPGVVGVFCRTYDIHDAINTFLSDVYEPIDHDDRYTYLNGSTSGGLVVYDDKFAYSNHSTDPAGSQLCNAFDLVRIHQYGDLDKDAKEGTPVNKMPSYLAMCEMAVEDPTVKKALIQEKLDSAQEDFEGVDGEPTSDTDEDAWVSKLQMDTKGAFVKSAHNIQLILENDKELKDLVIWNEFFSRPEVTRTPPWPKIKSVTEWSDSDDSGVRTFIEKKYGIEHTQKIKDGLNLLFQKNSYHPVRNFLDTLEWDGVERLDTLLIDYLGAKDTKLNRAMTRKTFTAAVTRIYKPGTKFEYMLTLVGAQGIGKSTLIRKMSKGYFSDSITISSGKDAMDQLDGVWIAEMAELNATRRAEVEEFKRFISSDSDDGRRAYQQRKTWNKRECIFIGSTNESVFLRDTSGNRRYWPVETSDNFTKDVFKQLDGEVDQILAEAKYRYQQGEELYLDKKMSEDLISVHSDFYQEHPIVEAIEQFLEIPLPSKYEEMNLHARIAYFNQDDEITQAIDEDGRPRDRVTPMLIWQECLGNANKRLVSSDKKIIMEYFRKHPDWEYTVIRIPHYGSPTARGFIKK